MPDPALATRYMARFRCIGGDCEDTCCRVSDWTVAVLEPDYRKVEEALASTDADRTRFASLFERVEPGPGRPFAVLRPRADGHCSLLSEDRSCELHRRFGEPVLPTPCSMYPRFVTRVGERLELSGRLSCPEVARQCLLASDAVSAVPVTEEALGRAFVTLSVAATETSHPYVEAFEPVREVLVGLLTLPRFPWRSRAFFVGYFAHRMGEFFRRDSPPCDPEQVAAVVSEIGRREVLDGLHDKFTAAPENDALALAAVRALVLGRLESAAVPALRRVAQAAGLERPVEELARAHAERRARFAPLLGARSDLWFANFCQNYFLQDWYLQSPSLMEHLIALVLRTATVQMLLLAHPGLERALLALDRTAACDAVAVEVFYSVARAFDHNESVRAHLSRAIAEHGLSTLAHATAFLKL